MSTRLYLTERAESGTPAPDASWEDTGTFARRTASLIPENTAFATSIPNANGNANDDTLVRQYISPALDGAQTIGTGTFKGQMKWREPSVLNDSRTQIVVRVFQSDLSTVRGTLYAGDTGGLANEFSGTLTNRRIPRTAGSALSSVSAQDGDFIVIEVGFRQHAARASTTNEVRVGTSDLVGDLPEDESTTADLNPWVEFSEDFVFKPTDAAMRATNVIAEVLYAPDDADVMMRATSVIVEVLYLPGPDAPKTQVIWID